MQWKGSIRRLQGLYNSFVGPLLPYSLEGLRAQGIGVQGIESVEMIALSFSLTSFSLSLNTKRHAVERGAHQIFGAASRAETGGASAC